MGDKLEALLEESLIVALETKALKLRHKNSPCWKDTKTGNKKFTKVDEASSGSRTDYRSLEISLFYCHPRIPLSGIQRYQLLRTSGFPIKAFGNDKLFLTGH